MPLAEIAGADSMTASLIVMASAGPPLAGIEKRLV